MPTTVELNARPELLMGPNPLIEAAEPFIPFDDLPDRIGKRPLEGRDWRLISPAARETLLDYAGQHIVATSLVLEPAAGIQRLFRRGLMLRNPLDPIERIRTARVASALTPKEFSALPRLEGAGSFWAGITGMGKTSIALRVLEIICPRQVILHEANELAGWLRCVQCCYLYVDQPSNGSRGGLLHRILVALDEQLGTDYSVQHKNSRNLDVLLVAVTKYLVIHRVALLVIDEKQAQNFSDSPWQIEFVLFYLSLMNLGISVLLLGNPLAFEHLRIFSQVMRRFSIGGTFELQPAKQDESWWCDHFVPQKQQFNLVEDCRLSFEERAKISYDASGGNPGLFELFDTEAQRCALRRAQKKKAVLTLADFEEAKESPRYKSLLQISTSFHLDDGNYVDIRTSDAADAKSKKMSGPKAASQVVSSLLGRFKAEQTRRTNDLQKKLRVIGGLSEDDLRMLGVEEDMLSMLVEGSPYALDVEKRKPKRPKAAA